MFQYAGTVEQAEWNDEQQKKQLEVRHLPYVYRALAHLLPSCRDISPDSRERRGEKRLLSLLKVLLSPLRPQLRGRWLL